MSNDRHPFYYCAHSARHWASLIVKLSASGKRKGETSHMSYSRLPHLVVNGEPLSGWPLLCAACVFSVYTTVLFFFLSCALGPKPDAGAPRHWFETIPCSLSNVNGKRPTAPSKHEIKLGFDVIITWMPMKTPHDGRIEVMKRMETLLQIIYTTIHPIVVSTSGEDLADSGLLNMLLPLRRSLVSQ